MVRAMPMRTWSAAWAAERSVVSARATTAARRCMRFHPSVFVGWAKSPKHCHPRGQRRDGDFAHVERQYNAPLPTLRRNHRQQQIRRLVAAGVERVGARVVVGVIMHVRLAANAIPWLHV